MPQIVANDGPVVVSPTADVGQRGSRRRLDIQGLRAIAVLLVVAFHAGLPVPGGFTGVDVFFVVSGFVITTMLVGELEQTNRASFRAFYTRRVRRILPALALVVVVVAVLSVFILLPLQPLQSAAQTGIAGSLVSANMYLYRFGAGGYFDLGTATNPLLHIWSLSVEEQFYLVFPAFLVFGWRLAGRIVPDWSRRKTTAAIVIVAIAVSFVLSLSLTAGAPTFAFYSSPTRAWEFGIGALLALWSPSLRSIGQRVSSVCAVAGLALILVSGFGITAAMAFPGVVAVIPVLGTGLLLVAGTAGVPWLTNALGERHLVWIGDVSYGWYLWHWPLIVFAGLIWPGQRLVLVVAAAASLVPTWLSYRWVETPLRFDRRIRGRRAAGLAAICISVPIIVCLAVLLFSRSVATTDTIRDLEEARQFHQDYTAGCYLGQPVGENADCTWKVPGATGTVFLVGDSNAGQFAEPVIEAAQRSHQNLTLTTWHGCPFVDLVVDGLAVDGGACREFVSQAVEAIVAARPPLVVVASSSSTYVSNELTRKMPSAFVFRDPRTGEVATTLDAKQRLWEIGTNSVLARFDRAGIPVLLVNTIPHFPGWSLMDCVAVRLALDAPSCGTSVPRQEMTARQDPARLAESSAAAPFAHVTVIDFSADICTTAECAPFRNGRWYYRDDYHLSVYGAELLTDRFARIVAQSVAATAAPG